MKRFILIGIFFLVALRGPCLGQMSLSLQEGIEQNRNFYRDGFWTQQWVRGLPPDDQLYLLVVQGPESWLGLQNGKLAVGDVVSRNLEPVTELRMVIDSARLGEMRDPVLLAGRVIALVRPVEVDGKTAVARHERLWLLWEVLADAAHADTLSASIGAFQTLHEMGVEARLARYPSRRNTYAYGLAIDAAVPLKGAEWAVAVGKTTLLPVARSAVPVEGLQPKQLRVWTWEEVLQPEWIPSPEPIAGSDSSAATEEGLAKILETGTIPDICNQATEFGYECVPNDPKGIRNSTLLAISFALVTVLVLLLGSFYRRRWQRLQRVSAKRNQRFAGRF